MSNQPLVSSTQLPFIRTAGLWCIIGGVIAAVGSVATQLLPSAVPPNSVSAPYTPVVHIWLQLLWAISYALILLGIVGLWRTEAVGNSVLGKIGLWLAIIGQATLMAGNVAYAFFPTAVVTDAPIVALDTIMGIASLVIALGMTLAGVAVLRAGRWQGWHRFVPLLCGLVVLLLLLPALMLFPAYFRFPLALWSLCFVLLGYALYQQATPPALVGNAQRMNAIG